MLARELLRDRPAEVRDRLATRGVEAELFNTWEELDLRRRESLVEMEELKRQRNEASKAIGKIKGEGGDATEQIEEVERDVDFLCASAETRTAIDEVERALESLEGAFEAWLRILLNSTVRSTSRAIRVPARRLTIA